MCSRGQASGCVCKFPFSDKNQVKVPSRDLTSPDGAVSSRDPSFHPMHRPHRRRGAGGSRPQAAGVPRPPRGEVQARARDPSRW